VALHDGEVEAGEAIVRRLLARQCPDWAGLPLTAAGAGTDNTMYRLGDELLVRIPRTVGTARALRKEQEWLPRLAPLLPYRIPVPVHAGTPDDGFPLPWAVYEWIDGDEAGPDTVADWAAYGGALAGFVDALHAADLMGSVRDGDLSWYRGGGLSDCDDWVGGYLDDCRSVAGLDVDTLTRLWVEGRDLPEPAGAQVWLHGDLKPTNVVVNGGKLHAVIDWGCLSVGFPDAEHATIWDLPGEARRAYWDAVNIDDDTWVRARAWAVAVGVSGVAYYRDTYPAFVAECRARLAAILDDAAAR
jgi:aminoglycoside phosphotransferase (APT) family kinase protein